MTGFNLRKNQRLKKLVPVRYVMRDGIAGEGIIKDLSLSGSYMTGNAVVSVGMMLALQIFVPGDPEVVLIDQATVKWVKGSEFGVNFETLPPNVAAHVTTIIATLVKKATWPSTTDATPC
jgi:PilZ domain